MTFRRRELEVVQMFDPVDWASLATSVGLGGTVNVSKTANVVGTMINSTNVNVATFTTTTININTNTTTTLGTVDLSTFNSWGWGVSR